MFDDKEYDIKESDIQKPQSKKFKYSEAIHSSLEYHTLKVPPIMEYKTIENYCEKKFGTSLCDPESQVTINSLQSVGSPVIFKTPRPVAANKTLPNDECVPYCYFSVEELSLVKSLENWSNVEVCPVGKVTYPSNVFCWLNSVEENGCWKVLVDFSLLEENPSPYQLLQVFGFLSIFEGKPKISAHFVRNLKTADLSLFVESYKYMQKYIPNNVLKSPKTSKTEEVERGKIVGGCEMNDTLDDFSFTEIL